MTNWTVKTYQASILIKEIKDKNIKVPHYQRGQIWKTSQKEKLIDSIKSGYPFGTILLYKKEDNTYQLIDGLQRTSTIYEYLHSPAKFFSESDISEDSIDKIYNLLAIQGGNQIDIKEEVVKSIKEWVVSHHHTMSEVKDINENDCAMQLKSKFPTCTYKAVLDIANILRKEFKKFKDDCEDLAKAQIPAIVYIGNSDNLPEVFNRINSKGTTLSKYQILSATWSTYEYILMNLKLDPIINYVDRFYVSILDENFDVDGYDQQTLHQLKKLNLYQILFGFSKLLSDKFPYLFNKSKNDKDIESCAFNLVNACLGNKNNKISHLPSILKETFHNDSQLISDFLVNIMESIDDIYKELRPYLEFKLNKRKNKIEIYHTEFQICSIISNYFNAKYVVYTFDDNNKIIGRNIKTDSCNITFENFKRDFKNNMIKKYLIDIINNNWSGSGDTRLDEVSLNQNYYTETISIESMINELDHWFNQMNMNRHEIRTVANPKGPEKFLLSVIYSHSFSAFEQNDDINYDIEHLAPKGCLKILLNDFLHDSGETSGLPISSFGNLCLLREEINRKKKDKTLYQDSKYLSVLEEKNISIEEIEDKFSFTNEKDLEWINKKYMNFSQLKKDYLAFLNERFKKQKKFIIKNLFNCTDEYYMNIESQNLNLKNQQQNKYFNAINQIDGNTPIIQRVPLIHLSKSEGIDQENIITLDSCIAKSQLGGWQREIFNIIDTFENDVFDLNQIYSFNEILEKNHLNNHHIQSKVRQILQQLRDLGLIEFYGNGKYKRLWKK